ncbi:hypothetical protein N9L68_06620 [bacterium]|nr:hypothetical protein [bacterium]
MPDANFITACSSCKDLSTLQGNPSGTSVLSKEESPGGTAATWKGLLVLLDNDLVDIVIYDDVDNMDDGASDKLRYGSNIQMLKAQFASRGCEGHNMLLDSWKFGSSARRRRSWFMQVRTTGPLGCMEFAGERSVTDISETFRGLLGICQRRPCGVEALLLHDDNPHVEYGLFRRTASGKDSDPEGWLLKHYKDYIHIRISMGTPSPYDATTSSSWYQTLCGCQISVFV